MGRSVVRSSKTGKRFSMEGTEWIALRHETVAQLEQALVETFGKSPAYAVLYHVGYSMGRKAFQRYAAEAKTMKPQAVLAVYARRKKDANWGRYSFQTLDPKASHVVVRVYGCFEKKAGVFKDCPLTKGYTCGFFSAMFKTDVTATEKCSTKFCEFHVKGNRAESAQSSIGPML